MYSLPESHWSVSSSCSLNKWSQEFCTWALRSYFGFGVSTRGSLEQTIPECEPMLPAHWHRACGYGTQSPPEHSSQELTKRHSGFHLRGQRLIRQKWSESNFPADKVEHFLSLQNHWEVCLSLTYNPSWPWSWLDEWTD